MRQPSGQRMPSDHLSSGSGFGHVASSLAFCATSWKSLCQSKHIALTVKSRRGPFTHACKEERTHGAHRQRQAAQARPRRPHAQNARHPQRHAQGQNQLAGPKAEVSATTVAEIRKLHEANCTIECTVRTPEPGPPILNRHERRRLAALARKRRAA